MLGHAFVLADRDVARLPVVAHAVVDLVALAVEDVEGGFVHVAVLLRAPSGAVFLEVQMEGLRDAVLGLDIVAARGLRALAELDEAAPARAPRGARALPLLPQAGLALDPAHEQARRLSRVSALLM